MRVCALIASLLLLIGTMHCVADDAQLSQARSLLLRGRYAEALEMAQALTEDHPADAAVLQADALVAQGKQSAALEQLKGLDDQQRTAKVLRRLADWQRESDPEESQRIVADLLARDPDDIEARWLHSQLAMQGGDIEQIRNSLAWFGEEAFEAKPNSAEAAIALAQGLIEYSAWFHEPKWYEVAVNEVLGEADRQFANDWRIPHHRARFFASKHNEPAAVDALNAALARNTSAAELHALQARFAVDKFDLATARRAISQAKRLNASLPEVALVEADIAFCELRPEEALRILEEMETANPPEVQGRIAAAELAMNRKPIAAPDKSKHPATYAAFYVAQGEAFERMRRFSQAAEAYRRASEVSEYPGVSGRLAQQLHRLAEDAEAARLLSIAQQEDPFDVRLKNTLAVLEVLETYAVLETDHFEIRFDRGQDELLAHYVAEYLEQEVYGDLVERFGYKPEGKSRIEIYSRARNTSGHGWFSARMVGLPGLHTIGACSGKVVAIASPREMPRPYNWARVLRHEFVHRLNLEQTAFNVPHWVTEGLAVYAEDRPRPASWLKLLTQREKDDALFTLADINFGFIRPNSSDDWTTAYAQAELYIEYLEQTAGKQAIPKLLEAFRDNLSTEQAIEKASGQTLETFEQGYRKFVREVVDQNGLREAVPSREADRLEKQVQAEPDNPKLLAELALAHLAESNLTAARRRAMQAQRLDPKQQTAAYVLASLELRAGSPAAAERIAQTALDLKQPHPLLLLQLADAKLAAKQEMLAEKLLLLGKKHFPALEDWNIRLAKIYERQQNDTKLEPVLIELAATKEDDTTIRLKLADMARARGDSKALERWAKEAICSDVSTTFPHADLAKIHLARGDSKAALFEWETAVRLDPKRPEWKLELAKLHLALGDREKARALLDELANTHPSLPGLVEAAQQLRP